MGAVTHHRIGTMVDGKPGALLQVVRGLLLGGAGDLVGMDRQDNIIRLQLGLEDRLFQPLQILGMAQSLIPGGYPPPEKSHTW